MKQPSSLSSVRSLSVTKRLLSFFVFFTQKSQSVFQRPDTQLWFYRPDGAAAAVVKSGCVLVSRHVSVSDRSRWDVATEPRPDFYLLHANWWFASASCSAVLTDLTQTGRAARQRAMKRERYLKGNGLLLIGDGNETSTHLCWMKTCLFVLSDEEVKPRETCSQLENVKCSWRRVKIKI